MASAACALLIYLRTSSAIPDSRGCILENLMYLILLLCVLNLTYSIIFHWIVLVHQIYVISIYTLYPHGDMNHYSDFRNNSYKNRLRYLYSFTMQHTSMSLCPNKYLDHLPLNHIVLDF